MTFRFSRSPVTATLLIIITAVMGYEWFIGAFQNDAILVQLGAIIPELWQRHEYWRLLTAMFLHANLLHWAANSWALFQLGSLYEVMFGSARFAAFYFITGICASIASSLNPNHFSVGASGAILGILGGFIFSIRRSPQWRHEPWTRGLMQQLVFWALLNVGLGFTIKQIDNTAHIAGLISGLLLGLIPHRVPPPPPSSTVIDVAPYRGSVGE
jgi:rhomboid protease GluP